MAAPVWPTSLSGAIIAAELHEADQGDTVSLPVTLEAAMEQLAALDAAPTPEVPAELIADNGYHSRDTLKRLADGPWKTRLSERRLEGVLRWHGDHASPHWCGRPSERDSRGLPDGGKRAAERTSAAVRQSSWTDAIHKREDAES